MTKALISLERIMKGCVETDAICDLYTTQMTEPLCIAEKTESRRVVARNRVGAATRRSTQGSVPLTTLKKKQYMLKYVG